MIRKIREDELHRLLVLYTHLHEDGIPDDTERLKSVWQSITNDENHHIIICDIDGEIVSSCVCAIIPNLTRDLRPYAVIENVVTHRNYRGKGYASACLDFARKIAKENNCYKMMLLTGAKDEKTLRFYKNAGYNADDKTAFVQWL